MRKRNRRYAAGILFGLFAGANVLSAAAGTWQMNLFGDGIWTYQDTSEVQENGWKWIDGNKDGIFECYYQKDKKMVAGTSVDGYQVNGDGQWTQNGAVVQRKLPDWISSVTVSEDTDYGTLQYPQIELKNKEAEKKINEELKKNAEGIRDGFIGMTGDSVYAGSLINRLDYDFILGNDSYVSLTLRNESYSGGAHGSVVDFYYTITPEKGILQLEDLGGEALKQEILASVRRTLGKEQTEGKITLFEEADQITSSFDKNWLLAEDGLHVMFGQYEIAPYSEGMIDVTVPYHEIAGSLNEYGKQLLHIS